MNLNVPENADFLKQEMPRTFEENIKEIEYKYKLIKGGDGHLYVSIQPLMNDIVKSVQKMKEMDTSQLSPEQAKIFELKLLGLLTIYEFMGGFITEQQLKDKAEEISGNIALNVTPGSI